MHKLKIIPICLALLLLCKQGYSQNLFVFMKIDGIPGEYNFPGGIADGNNSVELKSFGFVEANSVSQPRSGNPLGYGKADIPEFEFVVEPMDKAIVGLYQKLMSSTQAAAEIRVYVYAQDAGGAYKPIESIRLKKPRVIEIKVNGANDNGVGISSTIILKYEAFQKTGYNYVLGTFTPDGTTVVTWNYVNSNQTY